MGRRVARGVLAGARDGGRPSSACTSSYRRCHCEGAKRRSNPDWAAGAVVWIGSRPRPPRRHCEVAAFGLDHAKAARDRLVEKGDTLRAAPLFIAARTN
jgi:hypothetical protein